MSVRLKIENADELIQMGELQDGQIAIIVGSDYNGRIVQRYKDYGVPIGKGSGHGWTDVEHNTLLVRVLTHGELLEII
jgi:hypothetical protein